MTGRYAGPESVRAALMSSAPAVMLPVTGPVPTAPSGGTDDQAPESDHEARISRLERDQAGQDDRITQLEQLAHTHALDELDDGDGGDGGDAA